MPVNDCSTYLIICKECIRQLKKILTISDSLLHFVKTIDTVPHEATLRASNSQGIDVHTTVGIEDMYTDICWQMK
jgi:hypothetical protein